MSDDRDLAVRAAEDGFIPGRGICDHEGHDWGDGGICIVCGERLRCALCGEYVRLDALVSHLGPDHPTPTTTDAEDG